MERWGVVEGAQLLQAPVGLLSGPFALALRRQGAAHLSLPLHPSAASSFYAGRVLAAGPALLAKCSEVTERQVAFPEKHLTLALH